MTKLNNMLKVNDHVVITKMSINYLRVLECKSFRTRKIENMI